MQTYRLDITTVDDRPWWWLRELIRSLTDTPSRLQAWLARQENP